MNEVKIGIQLYSVRDPLSKDFRGTLEKLAAMGFQGCELAFFYGGLEPAELAKLFREMRLEVCGIYESFQNLCDGKGKVYEYAKALGCKYLTSGFGQQELRDKLQECTGTAKKACDVAAGMGMKICYHAHAHEFSDKAGGVCVMDRLLSDVPAMMFEADTAWIKVGGEDVIGYMRKQSRRIPLIHAKDVKADGKITELGNGVIDFRAVAEFAKSNRTAWISYEQDSSELTPLESARISIAHLKKMIG